MNWKVVRGIFGAVEGTSATRGVERFNVVIGSFAPTERQAGLRGRDNDGLHPLRYDDLELSGGVPLRLKHRSSPEAPQARHLGNGLGHASTVPPHFSLNLAAK